MFIFFQYPGYQVVSLALPPNSCYHFIKHRYIPIILQKFWENIFPKEILKKLSNGAIQKVRSFQRFGP